MENSSATPVPNIPSLYNEELKALVSQGIVKPKKFLKLLYKTNGNIEVIIKFLNAKKDLKEAIARELMQSDTLKLLKVTISFLIA
jgi:hypothetical protein